MRARLLEGFRILISDAQQTGEILTTEDPVVLARHTFLTLATSSRWWLGSCAMPDWRTRLREYERLLKLQIEGFKPAAAPEAAILPAMKALTARRAKIN